MNITERKFSVIVPTLGRCTEITALLLQNLYADTSVEEVILIDNTGGDAYDKLPHSAKLKVHKAESNLYVNPSWNLGARMAAQNYIALLNDDITIPEGIFFDIAQVPLESVGMLGAWRGHIKEVAKPDRFDVENFQVSAIDARTWGYGIFMVMDKNHYAEIPEDLKVWCGDDVLFDANKKAGRTNGVLLFDIQTKMNTTSKSKEFDELKRNDLNLYNTIYKVD